MDVKKLVIVMSISIVCVIGLVALIVNLNKEPIKIIATDLSEKIGYDIAKEYYNFSNKNEAKYFGIESMDDAYNSLIEGENAVVLSVFPSSEILTILENKNVEIETYSIAKDALVFINNKINPVTNLKSEDVKKVYSKRLTSWSDVGGACLDIIAYQSKSGEDLYYAFKNFMGDYTLEKPKIRLKNETFSGLMNAITKYLDTRKSALGYINFNTINSDEIDDDVRMLKLDNVEPNVTTIYTDEYPGTFNLCLVVRKDSLDNSQVKKLVEYIKSTKGQTVIRESGYITVGK